MQQIEFKFCEDTRPEAQLNRAREQHSMLVSNLPRQSYNRVHLHTILCGVMGTNYTHYKDSPLQSLGLDDWLIINAKKSYQRAKHSIKHATRLIQTRYALQYSKSPQTNGAGQVVGVDASACNPPDPH